MVFAEEWFMRRATSLLFLAAVLAAALGQTALSDTQDGALWTGAVSTDWNNAGNWNSNGGAFAVPPNAGDYAQFDTVLAGFPSKTAVVLNGNYTAAALIFGSLVTAPTGGTGVGWTISGTGTLHTHGIYSFTSASAYAGSIPTNWNKVTVSNLVMDLGDTVFQAPAANSGLQVSSAISGAGNLTLIGGGSQTNGIVYLSGANTYTGQTHLGTTGAGGGGVYFNTIGNAGGSCRPSRNNERW
jgi:hypothetical protein